MAKLFIEFETLTLRFNILRTISHYLTGNIIKLALLDRYHVIFIIDFGDTINKTTFCCNNKRVSHGKYSYLI